MKIKVGEYIVVVYSNGLKVYNSKGDVVHTKDNTEECWYDYDNDGNCIHAKNSRGDERWVDFNSHREMIHVRYSNWPECWYDRCNNKISKDQFDELYETKTTYTLKNKL